MASIVASPAGLTAYPEVSAYLATRHSDCKWSPQTNYSSAFANIQAKLPDTGETVGFLSLSSQPVLFGSTAHKAGVGSWLRQAVQDLSYNSSTSAFITCCVVSPGYEASAVEALLRGAFQSSPLLQTLLLAGTPQQLSACSSLQQQLATVTHSSSEAGGLVLQLMECGRSSLLGHLQVRKARVEDHDDLMAVLGAAGGRYPSLAALPDACSPEEPYALTGLIQQQDGRNVVLVAEDKGRVVGFLAATGDVDIPLLQQSFDLAPYDAFLPSPVYSSLEAQARQAAAAAAASAAAAAQGEGGEVVLEASSEEEVQAQLAELVFGVLEAEPEAHTLAVITMLCMLPEFEEQAGDFIEPLFEALPNKLYCALSLPRTSAEPPLSRLMTPVTPLPGAHFPEVLRLLQPAALLPDWVVRRALPSDAGGVEQLVTGMVGAQDLLQAFLEAMGAKSAVVGLVQGEVVAIATTTLSVNVPLLTANFDLDELMVGQVPRPEQHAELNACIINPIFAARGAAFLNGVLRALGKDVLHYALPPAQPAPEVLQHMHQARARRRSTPATADFSLYCFTPSMACCPRKRVNAQVVLAGASETSLSCLEAIMFDRSRCASNLMLLAPGGIGVGGVACQFTAPLLQRLGLGAAATLVDGRLVALDKEQQLILLDDGNSIQYDMLVLAAGVQDQLGASMAASCPEAAHFVVPGQQLVAELNKEDAAALRSVLVYGISLDSYTLLAALTTKGVAPEVITWVAPEVVAQEQSVVLLRALAAEAELPLPEHQVGALHSMRLNEEGDQAVCVLQASDGVLQELEVDLVLGCSPPLPAADTAAACAAAGLVWDGRLVVDARFHTCDPHVMAAGPMTRFSNRYGGQGLGQVCFNSSEVGQALASSLLQSLDAEQGTRSSSSNVVSSTMLRASAAGGTAVPPWAAARKQLPVLSEGKLVGATLPGGWTFALATSPAFLQQQEVERAARLGQERQQQAALQVLGAGDAAPAHDDHTSGLQIAWVPEGGGALLSRGAGGVLLVVLDGGCTITQVGYLGPQPASVNQLGALVGLHISYLAAGCGLPQEWQDGGHAFIAAVAASSSSNEGVRCLELAAAGVVLLEQDLLVALAQPWAEPLFHDRFKVLRRQLLGAAVAGQARSQKAAAEAAGGSEADDCAQEKDTAAAVRGQVLQWVLRCGEELPGLQQRLVEALKVSGQAC